MVKQHGKEKTPEERKQKRDAKRERMEQNWVFTDG
jgi:hypothetical protein